MAQGSGSPFVADISGAATNFLDAFNASRDRQLKEKQLEIQQAIADRRISVAEGDLLLRQEEARASQQAQTDIQANLQQQAELIRGGGQQPSINDQLSRQLNLAQDPTSATGGLIDPSQAIAPQPERIQLTPAMKRDQDALSAELLGIKGGFQVFNQFKSVLDRGDKRELALAKEEIEDEQRFALSLSRADTRDKKNRLIDSEISKELVATGEMPQELLRMRNLDDEGLDANVFTGLAQGDVLQKLIENQLIPPTVATSISKPSPKDFTPESLAKFSTSRNFADLVRVKKGPSSQIISSLAPLFLAGLDFDKPEELGLAMAKIDLVASALSGQGPKETQKLLRNLNKLRKLQPKPAEGEEEVGVIESTFGKTFADFWAQPVDKIVSDIKGFSNESPQAVRQRGRQVAPQTTRQRQRPQATSLVNIQRSFPRALTDNEGFVYIPDNRFPTGRRFITNRAGNKIRAQ